MVHWCRISALLVTLNIFHTLFWLLTFSKKILADYPLWIKLTIKQSKVLEQWPQTNHVVSGILIGFPLQEANFWPLTNLARCSSGIDIAFFNKFLLLVQTIKTCWLIETCCNLSFSSEITWRVKFGLNYCFIYASFTKIQFGLKSLNDKPFASQYDLFPPLTILYNFLEAVFSSITM